MSLSFMITALAIPNETSELKKPEQIDANTLVQVEDYSTTITPDTCTSKYDIYILI